MEMDEAAEAATDEMDAAADDSEARTEEVAGV